MASLHPSYRASRRTFASIIVAAAFAAACGGGSGASDQGDSLDSGKSLGSGAPVNGDRCDKLGTTRSCCTTGSQTCASAGEFSVWGQCVDANGSSLSCSPSSGGADAGVIVDAGHTTTGGGQADAGPQPTLCRNQAVNTKPEILVSSAPANGGTVGADGTIKVWVHDTHAPKIAPGESVDPNTGVISKPGDRLSRAADGFLFEPALYLAPAVVENGGAPHFPTTMKGAISNNPLLVNVPPTQSIPGMDPVPNPPIGVKLDSGDTAEYIWDAHTLGVTSGTYWAEFVIHGGEADRAIGCVIITIP